MKNILLIFFSAMLTLTACEFGLRLYDHLLSLRYTGEEGDKAIPWLYDSLLGWKFEPNRVAVFSSKVNRFRASVKINSKGLRDSDYEYKKEKGVKRILLLGDSVTAGLEVEKEEVIDARLEHYLGPHGRYEVINAGVRGYGTDQEYLWLKHEGYKYEPDIVIYIYYLNDPMNNVNIHYPSAKFGKPYFAFDDKNELVLKGVPVPERFEPFDKHLTSDKAHQHIYDARAEEVKSKKQSESFLRQLHVGSLVIQGLKTLEENRFIKPVLVKLNLSSYQKPEEPGLEEYRWRITKAIIRNMKTLSDDLGAKFLVYESTSDPARPPYYTSRPLYLACAELGVNYFGSIEEFYKGSRRKKVFRFEWDFHWNARGHDLAAKSLYEYLRRNRWIAEPSA